MDRHLVDADPDPNVLVDADPDPDPDWHSNEADPDGDPTPSLDGKSEILFYFKSQHCHLSECFIFLISVKCFIIYLYFQQHIEFI